MKVRSSNKVLVGGIEIGGGAPITVQSMLNTDPHNATACIAQAQALVQAGCNIIRTTVPDLQAAQVITQLKKAVSCPIVADIHFDYRLAIASVQAGADKIRINPGNIGGIEKVREVASACSAVGVPIRIGVNGGSLEKDILAKYGAATAQAMVESAARHIDILAEVGFENVILSLKSSDVKTTLDAYRLAAKRFSCPLHLGVTEAGTAHMGLIKSAIGIGSLLADGIGDTIRVSLTADPVEEIAVARDIIKAAGRSTEGVTVISCPTCGRTKVDVISLANAVESALKDSKKQLKVAVMGCAVNGPGEAKEADIGIACGDGEGLIFKKGEIIGKVPESELLSALMSYIEQMDSI